LCSDYTLHPSPAPAHPSHRLVPALRLLALPELPASLENTQHTAYPHTRAAPPPAPASPAADALRAWDATLLGLRERVDAANETAARALLRRICEEFDADGRARLARLDAQPPEMPAARQMIRALAHEELRVVRRVLSALDDEVPW
jgi:hypothetical protein